MTKDEVLRLAHEGVEIHSPNAPEYKVCAALIAALEAKDESVNDELRRLHDLLGKANALARIRAAEIESMKASLYGLYELEKQRDEFEQRLTKTEAQLGEAVWNYGELKREQLANQQNTSGSPIFSELHCICGAEWEWRNRDWELVTTPPQRTWVELTHADFKSATRFESTKSHAELDLSKAFWAGARWAEAKLKEKNSL